MTQGESCLVWFEIITQIFACILISSGLKMASSNVFHFNSFFKIILLSHIVRTIRRLKKKKRRILIRTISSVL